MMSLPERPAAMYEPNAVRVSARISACGADTTK